MTACTVCDLSFKQFCAAVLERSFICTRALRTGEKNPKTKMFLIVEDWIFYACVEKLIMKKMKYNNNNHIQKQT